jgi:hypothetical protein
MPDVRKTFTDAGYIAIGLGVMGFQQAQVRRRELQGRLENAGSCLADRARDARERAQEFAGEIGQRVEPLKGQVEGRLGDLPDRINKAVEGSLGDLPERVNKAVEEATTRVRDLVNRAA